MTEKRNKTVSGNMIGRENQHILYTERMGVKLMRTNNKRSAKCKSEIWISGGKYGKLLGRKDESVSQGQTRVRVAAFQGDAIVAARAAASRGG